jgi:predicted DNA-binding protein
MAVGKDKDRIIVTTTKDIKEELQKLAKKDDRNLSNYVNKILRKHIEDIKNNK